MIELHVEPRTVQAWDEFCDRSPRNSMALDGYVAGPPCFSHRGPYVNFNHHEGVDRLATRSTAAQVLISVKQDLFHTFRRDGAPFAHVFVNDADQDTSLAIWLLRNQERIAGSRSEPLISRLVFCSDMMDATAGAYPFPPDAEIMREMSWIYQPYESSRQTGHLLSLNAIEMETLIEAVGARISAYSLGKGGQVTPDTGYSTMHRGGGWVMVRELGAQARTRLFQDGIKAFVAVRDRPDGKYTYSIGRMSAFVDFPLDQFYVTLNKAEEIADGDTDRWGGSNMIGGSPRQGGSRLSPDDLARHIDAGMVRK